MPGPRCLQPLFVVVCKSFVTITNLIHITLTLPSPSSSVPPSQLYSRFPNLTSLHPPPQHPHPNLDGFVRELAQFSLPLHSLHVSRQSHFPNKAMRLLGYNLGNTLRTLSYTYFERFIDDDDFVFADCFSRLHWLD